MAILLNRIDHTENINRWYLVSIQATLFHPCAVVIAWGRRDNEFQQWRVIPVENQQHAARLAEKIVSRKIKRGYRIPTSAST
jgi:predicted DNA-binding WGR domain protein